jgi:uncharacterized protein (TIGR00106 family)
MALMQISVIPVGTGSAGVGDYIADIERFLRGRGIEHSLNDMGTVIAGTAQELLQLAHEVHRLPFTKGAERVITSITLDERLDRDIKIGEKQQSVIRRLRKSEAA